MATLKVKPWGEGQGDYVLIEEEDFDEKQHSLYDDKPAPKAKSKPAPKAEG